MDEGINWAVWIGISITFLLGLANLLYNFRRDRVRVVIVTEIGWEDDAYPVYRAVVTNTGFVGVKIQEVEVIAKDSQRRLPLISARGKPDKKLIDGDHQVWGLLLEEVESAFDDVPFHASTYVVARDTAGRKYRSRNWTTIRTSRPGLEDGSKL